MKPKKKRDTRAVWKLIVKLSQQKGGAMNSDFWAVPARGVGTRFRHDVFVPSEVH